MDELLAAVAKDKRFPEVIKAASAAPPKKLES